MLSYVDAQVARRSLYVTIPPRTANATNTPIILQKSVSGFLGQRRVKLTRGTTYNRSRCLDREHGHSCPTDRLPSS